MISFDYNVSFDMPSFDLLCKRIKDDLTVKLAIFLVISGRNDKEMITTDLKWLKKIVDFACFPISRIIQMILVPSIGSQ